MKDDDDKKTADLFKNIGSIILVIFFISVVIYWIMTGFNFVSKKLDKRSSRKAYCAEEIYNIKNEYTAKKVYEACMDR